jgi:hypothetical protein
MEDTRPRMQILSDIYRITFGEDPEVLRMTVYELFKKKTNQWGKLVDLLDNDQLEKLIPALKEKYGRHVQGLPDTQLTINQRGICTEPE